MCMPTPTNASGLGYSWGFTSTSDITKGDLDGTSNLSYTLGNTLSGSETTLTVASHKSPQLQDKITKGTQRRTMFLVNDTFPHTTVHRTTQPNHASIQGFTTSNLTGKHFMTPLGPIQLTAEECNEILMKRALQAAQGLPGGGAGGVLDASQLGHGGLLNGGGSLKGMGSVEGSGGSASPDLQQQSQQHPGQGMQQMQLVQTKQEPGTNSHSPKSIGLLQEPSIVSYRSRLSPNGHDQRPTIITPSMPKERPYSCDECGKSFLLKHHLTTHSRVHTGERPHACAHCGKAFAHKHCLNTHLLLHSAERPFQCHECKKSFTLKHHLLTHSRVHSRERPFVCTECGRGFPLKRHLVTHSKFHAGERPFVCQDCGESFAQKDHLVMHSRFHGSLNPFVCGDCGAAFTRKFQLVNHGRMHGRVPHACPICGKEFLQKRTLVAHMKLHTGDAQFACIDCGESFKGKNDLLQHIKILHPSNITTVSVGQQTGGGNTTPGPQQHQQHQSQQHQQHSVVDMKPQIVQVVGGGGDRKQKPSASGSVQLIGQDGSIHEKTSPGYSCQECGNCFNTKEALALHVRLHTGDGKFVTDLCALTAALQPGNFLNPSQGSQGASQGLQILTQSGVLQHTNNASVVTASVGSGGGGGGSGAGSVLVGVGHHTGTTVLHTQPRPKVHFCQDCGKGFASRHGLHQHQRRHPDGSCTLRTHVCNTCGKAFFQKNHLLLHQRQHMEIPPRNHQVIIPTDLYLEKQQQQELAAQQQQQQQQQNGQQQQQQLANDTSRQSDSSHSSSSTSNLQHSGPTHIQVTNREGQVIGNQILIGGSRNRQVIGNQIHIINREGKTIGTQITSPGTNLVHTIKQEHMQTNRDTQPSMGNQVTQQQLNSSHQQRESHQLNTTHHQVVSHNDAITQHQQQREQQQQQLVTLQQQQQHKDGHLVLRNATREVTGAQQLAQLQQVHIGQAHVIKYEIIPQQAVVQVQSIE